MNGKSVLGNRATIFDTGTTGIIGDPASIATLFAAINGSQPAPQLGEGLYTSAFSSVTCQSTRFHMQIQLLVSWFTGFFRNKADLAMI